MKTRKTTAPELTQTFFKRIQDNAPQMYAALKNADKTICELCKILNPQHVNCISCEEREHRLKALAKAEGR